MISLGFAEAARALLLTFAGGVLLNAMPCVFPILSLKALSLARSGQSAAAARAESRAYALGVVLAVLALSAVIIALKQVGVELGWAFQLTDPRAVFALALLVTAIALNLAGLFEITGVALGGEHLTARSGAKGAFWEADDAARERQHGDHPAARAFEEVGELGERGRERRVGTGVGSRGGEHASAG